MTISTWGWEIKWNDNGLGFADSLDIEWNPNNKRKLIFTINDNYIHNKNLLDDFINKNQGEYGKLCMKDKSIESYYYDANNSTIEIYGNLVLSSFSVNQNYSTSYTTYYNFTFYEGKQIKGIFKIDNNKVEVKNDKSKKLKTKEKENYKRKLTW